MDKHVTLKRFPDELSLEQASADAHNENWRDPSTGAACAWYLRQSEPLRAVEIARAFLARGAESNDSSDLPAGVAGYLSLALAEVSRLDGRVDDAQNELNAARSHFGEPRDDRGLSDADWLEASLRNDVGDKDGRETLLKHSLQLAEVLCDHERSASSTVALAFCDAFEDGEAAQVRWGVPVEAALASSIPALRGWAAFCMAQISMGRGDFNRALEFAIVQRHAFEACGLTCNFIQAAAQIASLLTSLGDFESSLRSLEQVLPIARGRGWPQPLGFCLTALSYAMQKLGRAEAARELSEEAVRVLSKSPRSTHYIAALFTLADASFACDRLDRASECYAVVASPECPSDIPEHKCYGLLGLARVALRRNELLTAEQRCREVLGLPGLALDPELRVETLRLLSKVSVSRRDALAAHERIEGVEAIADPIALLREAISLNEGSLNGTNSHELLGDLASLQERDGDAAGALASMKSAMQALLAQRAETATKQAVALQVRFKTERALAEAELHRTSAAIESTRAAELELLNGQLRSAVESLNEAQALLMLRNEELSQAHAQITDLSLTDPLTGLRNRRFLTHFIGVPVAESLRTHSAFDSTDGMRRPPGERKDIVFFLLDLDHFKQVNDEYGHHAGDAVLIQLGQRLRMVLRDQDFLVRWGGEEFLVAVCGIDRTEGPGLAERMRLGIGSSPFELGDGKAIHRTASIGFAAFPLEPEDPESASWEQVVELADARLYAAKRAGRNCCVGGSQCLVMQPMGAMKAFGIQDIGG